MRLVPASLAAVGTTTMATGTGVWRGSNSFTCNMTAAWWRLVAHRGGVPEVTGRTEVAPFLELFLAVMTGLFTEVSSRCSLFAPSPSRGIPTTGDDGENGSNPLSETFLGGDGGAVEWLQSENVEMPMVSLLEEAQQPAPKAVALAATAPATEAVPGTSVFPAASSKGVAEAPTSSAGAASAAVPATAPATDDTVFPTASVGGATRASSSADEAAALTAALATSDTVPSAAPVRGQSGRASRLLERRHRPQRVRHRRQYLQQRRRPTILFSPLHRWGGRPGRPLLQMKKRHCRWHWRPAILFPQLHQLGGSRGARVVCWSGVIGRSSGGGTVDRHYCCPCCVGG